MARLPNLGAIMYFEAVARHSRVNLAADELRVSSSAVSQQIKSLEEQMGILLFRRVKRRLVLTEDGEQLYRSAADAIALLRNAQSRVSRNRVHRTLMIRAATSFGVRWLGPLVHDFIAKNPQVDLHVDATSELTDFDKENVDLEIRYGHSPPAGFQGQSLITDHVLPMCSPKLAEAAAAMSPEEFLGEVRLIHTVKAAIRWSEWLAFNDIKDVEAYQGLRFDRSSMSLQAAVDGVGVVLETASLAMRELQSGLLVPMKPALGCMSFPTYWLICPPRHLNRRAVKAFVAWIQEQAEAHDAEKSKLLKSLKIKISHPYEPSIQGEGLDD